MALLYIQLPNLIQIGMDLREMVMDLMVEMVEW